MWGSNSGPQDQELHVLPTEPARHPLFIFFFLQKMQTFNSPTEGKIYLHLIFFLCSARVQGKSKFISLSSYIPWLAADSAFQNWKVFIFIRLILIIERVQRICFFLSLKTFLTFFFFLLC